MARDLDITVKVLDNEAHQQLVSVDRDIERLGTTAKTQTGFLDDLSAETLLVATGFIGATAAMAVFSTGYQALKQFIGESVTAFSEAEQAESRLIAALRQHSLATPEVIAQYNALGTTFQRTTIYADDEIQAMEALLTQVGGVMPSKMAGALKASTDLAAGLGIDLHTATNLVAKAAAGHTETLGRYGITVSQAALETKGFDAVLEAVNRQFGGQAEAALETYAGKVKQIGNAWNNFQEVVGKFVVQNEFAEAALRLATTAMTHLDESTGQATFSVTDLWKAANLPAPLIVAWLETYVAELNEAAEATARINKIPHPFDHMMATLPPITAGMKLFNEQVAESAKYNSAAAVKAREHAAGLAKLAEENEVLRDQASIMTSLTQFRTLADQRQAEIIRQQTAAVNDLVVAELKMKQASEDFLASELKAAQAQDALYQGLGQTKQGFDAAAAAAKAAADAFAVASAAAQSFALVNTDLGAALPTLGGPGQGATLPHITGQTRDVGGPVRAGQSYLIGRGAQPELFTPGSDGFMTPNGAGGTVIHVYVSGNNIDSDYRARRLADQTADRVMQRFKQQSRITYSKA